jgi:hypothetical protein
MGINSRRSLDPRWVTHHIPVIDGFKGCTVKVYRPDPDIQPVYDQQTRQYTSAPGTLVYEGKARIQPYGINLDLEVANDPTSRRLVLIQLEGKDLGIRNDDMVVVDETENIQDLKLYHFDVRGSIGSSMEWGTNLVCEANLKTQNAPVEVP